MASQNPNENQQRTQGLPTNEDLLRNMYQGTQVGQEDTPTAYIPHKKTLREKIFNPLVATATTLAFLAILGIRACSGVRPNPEELKAIESTIVRTKSEYPTETAKLETLEKKLEGYSSGPANKEIYCLAYLFLGENDSAFQTARSKARGKNPAAETLLYALQKEDNQTLEARTSGLYDANLPGATNGRIYYIPLSLSSSDELIGEARDFAYETSIGNSDTTKAGLMTAYLLAKGASQNERAKEAYKCFQISDRLYPSSKDEEKAWRAAAIAKIRNR